MEEKIVKELRKVQVEILSEIHKICVDNDIKYYLCGGTLLGAVRHKGFIPWDDDIDIAMPRKDYKRFFQICSNGGLGKDYFLQNTYTEKEYHLPFCKIRKNNTLFDERGVRNLSIHKGIFVDIFPLDYSNKKDGFCIRFRDTIVKNLVHVVSMRQLKANPVSNLNNILYIITKPLSVHQILKLSDFVSSVKKKGKYYVDFASYLDYTKETVPVKYYDRILLEFENKEFYAPREYNFILEKLYGDYMKLPPEEERVNHDAIRVVFDIENGC